MPTEETVAFLAHIAELPPLTPGDVDGIRARRRELGDLFGSGPASVAVRDDEVAGIPVRRYSSGPDGRTTVVFAHGGGWVAGDLDTHDGLCRHLALGGADVVAVDYRRAPEHPSPAAVEDVLAVLQAEEGVDRRLCLAGDSSGGHVALEAARAWSGSRPLDGMLLIQPACDPSLTAASWEAFGAGYFLTRPAMEWYWAQYRGTDGGAVWDEPLEGLPRTHVITSDLDPSLDEGRELVRRLRLAGVPVSEQELPGVPHACLSMPAAFPSLQPVLLDAGLWLAGWHYLPRLDPDLRASLEIYRDLRMPTGYAETVALRERFAAVPAPTVAAPEVVRIEREGAPSLDLRLTRPSRDASELTPAVYYVHGGGMTMGTAADVDAASAELADALGACVVAVDYRLAPEHPFPAAVEDAYDGWIWLCSAATTLGLDPRRLAISGGSAGGGIAAGVTLLVRERGAPAPVFQSLVAPMLDDRGETGSSREFVDIPSWNRAHNLFAWSCVLGDDVAGPDVSPSAAPARATDLTGLPPTLIQVGELDLFRDEDIAYASRLRAASVAVELIVYPGAHHGFDGADAPVARRARRDRIAALARALTPTPSPIREEPR